MPTFEGQGFTVSHNLDVVAMRMDRASSKVYDVAPVALTECGVWLLGEAQRDFRAKSKGQADAAGNTWPGVSEGAIRTRFWRTRRDHQYVKLAYRLQALRDQEESLLGFLIKQLPRGKNGVLSAWRRGIAWHWRRETPEGIQATQIRQQIKDIREDRQAMVTKDHAAAKTGVDSARLVNSLSFASTDKVFEIAGNVLTMGTAIVYAYWFDLRRKIFPDNFMTPRRLERCHSIVKKHAERKIQETLGDSAKGV